MKQTVFKGTVNGVEYNSVEKYNEAVNDALKKGIDIKASSNTEITDVPDEQEHVKKTFPFNNIEDVIKFTDDHSEDLDQALEYLSQEVQTQMSEFLKDKNKTKIVKPYIEKYYKTLGEKLDKYEVELDELTDDLAQLEDKFNKLTYIVDTLDTLYEVYGETLDSMDEQDIDDEVEEDCKCNCDNCKCKTKEHDKNDSFVSEFMKLLSKIK